MAVKYPAVIFRSQQTIKICANWQPFVKILFSIEAGAGGSFNPHFDDEKRTNRSECVKKCSKCAGAVVFNDTKKASILPLVTGIVFSL